MKKINYAIAMLSAAGGAAAMAPAAQAATLYGSFTNTGLGYSETFTLQSDGGFASSNGAAFTDFALSNDSLGNTVATVGDNTTGFKAELLGIPVDGYFGTGVTDVTGGTQTYDSLLPALYVAGTTPVLTPGTYVGDFDGYTLTLSEAVPEPETWALLIAGAALVGGAARASRRRGLAAV